MNDDMIGCLGMIAAVGVALIMGFLAGSGCGVTEGENLIRNIAIQNGAAYHTIDPVTGEKSIVWSEEFKVIEENEND